VRIQGQPSARKTKVIDDAEYFYCHGKVHGKRDCLKYLKDKKVGKVSVASSSILVIIINLATSLSDWILHIRLCAHIYSNIHALSEGMILNRGEV
jgi:hypothetical protein